MQRRTTPTGAQHAPDSTQFLSEPIPTDRCIRWNPLPDSYHLLAELLRAPRDEYKLLVSQDTLRHIDSHLRTATEERPAAGLLLGQLYEDPNTGGRYAVVRGIARLAEGAIVAEREELTEESWKKLGEAFRGHPREPLGWYRSRSVVGARLAPGDTMGHVRYFRNPWQTALVVSPDPEHPAGSFYVYEKRVARVYALPFYELFEPHPTRGTTGQRTWVRWQNYVTDSDLNELVDQVYATVDHSHGSQLSTERPSRVLGPLREAVEEAWAWVRAQRAPQVFSARPPRGPQPDRHSLDARARGPHDDESSPRQDLTAPLAVILPPGFFDSPRSAGRRALGAVAALLLIGITVAVAIVSRGGIAATSRAGARETPSVSESPAPESRGMMQPPGPTTEVLQSVPLFDAAADSLGSAIAAYRATARRYDAGTQGCDSLTAAFAAAGNTFTAVSDAHRVAEPALDVNRSMRFNKLAADVSELDRTYRRTSCARTPPTPPAAPPAAPR